MREKRLEVHLENNIQCAEHNDPHKKRSKNAPSQNRQIAQRDSRDGTEQHPSTQRGHYRDHCLNQKFHGFVPQPLLGQLRGTSLIKIPCKDSHTCRNGQIPHRRSGKAAAALPRKFPYSSAQHINGGCQRRGVQYLLQHLRKMRRLQKRIPVKHLKELQDPPYRQRPASQNGYRDQRIQQIPAQHHREKRQMIRHQKGYRQSKHRQRCLPQNTA